MRDIERPALAEVLTKLLDVSEYEEQPAFWLSLPYVSVRVGRFRLTEQSTGPEFDGVRFFAPRSNESGVVPRDVRRAWRHESPAEAVESLATAGLWPWEIGDTAAPRWWFGAGRATHRECWRVRDGLPCELCEGADDPPSHAALVAVASLGRPQILRITHTLAPEIARAAGCPDARVVWRVMEREAIQEHHQSEYAKACREHPMDRSIVGIFSAEAREAAAPYPMMLWNMGTFVYPDAVRRAWPALRSLAVGDEATLQPTGVHLVALDASRIVLGVEAL